MTTHGHFVKYLEQAPVALAIERTLECTILSRRELIPPALDIGCGDGLFASICFPQGLDTGIDPDRRELERARARAVYRELIPCRGDAIPKPSASYKTIVSNSVLEHILLLEPVLREAHRLLAADGIMYVTVPTDRFERFSLAYSVLTAFGLKRWASAFARTYNRFWLHYHCYSVDRWEEWFQTVGFTIVERVEYCPHHLALLDDVMTGPAALSLLAKKLVNRWVLFPSVRKAMAPVIAGLIRIDFAKNIAVQHGGIVFFQLRK
jgi:SAM-dependent methyltransferase